jgi:hypothetical protein
MARAIKKVIETGGVNALGYAVPKGEEKDYHVSIEQVRFDPVTGERLSKASVQKYNQRMWMLAEKNMKNLGYSCEILHDPTA